MPHGMGRIDYCDGSYYEGEFVSGKSHGQGKLQLIDGT